MGAASSSGSGTLASGSACNVTSKPAVDSSSSIDCRLKLGNCGALTYNDEPKGVYVIVQGSVSCYRVVNGKESYVDQMGESESFGELWLLADQPTAVRFVAAKNTRIRVVGRDTFNDLLDKDGLMARKLYKRFTMRLLKRLLKPQNTNAKAS